MKTLRERCLLAEGKVRIVGWRGAYGQPVKKAAR
jgi:hypothetical protein